MHLPIRPTAAVFLGSTALVGVSLFGAGLLGAGPLAPTEPLWLRSTPMVFAGEVQRLFATEGTETGAAFEALGARFEDLVAGLDRPGQEATRAAVLLGWRARESNEAGARAREALLARLEKREPAPSRALDAGDVLAASALARSPLGPEEVQRLVQLTDGDRCHPDLEVRVECAGGALLGGPTPEGLEVVATFLLRALRSGTPAEVLDPPDWPRKTTLTWAKSRSAEYLSRHAGVPCTFRADGSFDHQAAETQALLEALGWTGR